MFGFFSAFNPELINDMLLYKGGGPANYGGRISSVMNLILAAIFFISDFKSASVFCNKIVSCLTKDFNCLCLREWWFTDIIINIS